MASLDSCFVGVHIHWDVGTSTWREQLAIYNWKTGDMLLNLIASAPIGYAFFKDQYLLLAHEDQPNQVVLSVVNIPEARQSDSTRTISDLSVVCSLELPRTRYSVRSVIVGMDAAPSRLWHTRHGSPVPFELTGDRLYSVCLDFSTHIDEPAILLLPSSTISQIMELATLESFQFCWSQWGPLGSRLIRSLERLMRPQVAGMSAIVQTEDPSSFRPDSGKNSTSGVHLFYFGSESKFVRKYGADISAGKMSPGVEFCEEWSYGLSQVFEEQNITTHLPALHIELPYDLAYSPHGLDPEDYGREIEIELGDDCLLLMYSYEDYDVWTVLSF